MKHILSAIWLVFGALTISGCGTLWREPEPRPDEQAIVVNSCHFSDPKGGRVVVTREWMLMRLQLEQEMESALSSCLDKIDEMNHQLRLCLEH
jgi:hypothetical protein